MQHVHLKTFAQHVYIHMTRETPFRIVIPVPTSHNAIVSVRAFCGVVLRKLRTHTDFRVEVIRMADVIVDAGLGLCVCACLCVCGARVVDRTPNVCT